MHYQSNSLEPEWLKILWIWFRKFRLGQKTSSMRSEASWQTLQEIVALIWSHRTSYDCNLNFLKLNHVLQNRQNLNVNTLNWTLTQLIFRYVCRELCYQLIKLHTRTQNADVSHVSPPIGPLTCCSVSSSTNVHISDYLWGASLHLHSR